MWNPAYSAAEPVDPSDPAKAVIDEVKDLGERLDPAPATDVAAHLKRITAGMSELIDTYVQVAEEAESTWNSPSGRMYVSALRVLITQAQRVESVADEAAGTALNAAGLAEQMKNHALEVPDWVAGDELANAESASAAIDFRGEMEEDLRYLAERLDGSVDAAGGLRNVAAHDELLRDPYAAAPRDPLADTLQLARVVVVPHTQSASQVPRTRRVVAPRPARPARPMHPVNGVLEESADGGWKGTAQAHVPELATMWLAPPAEGVDPPAQPLAGDDVRRIDLTAPNAPRIVSAFGDRPPAFRRRRR
ncbi:hypothetical protein [Actinospica robiniae]|uniref:hypothetical protein n=1 Tax=Actinospica robiniae TaxID=304901 RepID=UPI000418A6DE|nr:hypothetical protein [Actinospica robiniae]